MVFIELGFSCVWTVQDILLARHAFFRLGPFFASVDQFEHVVDLLYKQHRNSIYGSLSWMDNAELVA